MKQDDIINRQTEKPTRSKKQRQDQLQAMKVGVINVKAVEEERAQKI